MKRFDYTESWKSLLTPNIVSLLTAIHEYKGEQNLFLSSHADSLNELLEIAKIQSTEYSNKIEGIYTSNERLKKIMLDQTMPKTRSEEEIAGYRDVLKVIHENYEYISLSSNVCLQLHGNLYKFSYVDGDCFKTSDNIIAQVDDSGNKSVRFNPVPAWQTKEAMDSLCDAYRADIDPLLKMPMFILDFLCIHPFNDGNGRMSRLLTLLLLYKSGYIVGKYISIEKLIESTKETYYEALQMSSYLWHENQNDYVPFVEYYLGIVLATYKDFSNRVQNPISSGLSKPERVRETIKGYLGKVTKSDILEQCPDISQITVQRTLSDLLAKNEIKKIGGGRYTSYVWNEEK